MTDKQSSFNEISSGFALSAVLDGSNTETDNRVIRSFIEFAVVAIVVIATLTAATPAHSDLFDDARSKYQARVRFTEVVTSTSAIKQQVELCFFDTGNFDKCTSGIKANHSLGERGWDLSRSPESYASRYVARIDVYRGVIIATAVLGEGLNGANIILVPVHDPKTEYDVYWGVHRDSTCIAMSLC